MLSSLNGYILARILQACMYNSVPMDMIEVQIDLVYLDGQTDRLIRKT